MILLVFSAKLPRLGRTRSDVGRFRHNDGFESEDEVACNQKLSLLSSSVDGEPLPVRGFVA